MELLTQYFTGHFTSLSEDSDDEEDKRKQQSNNKKKAPSESTLKTEKLAAPANLPPLLEVCALCVEIRCAWLILNVVVDLFFVSPLPNVLASVLRFL